VTSTLGYVTNMYEGRRNVGGTIRVGIYGVQTLNKAK
jgi:hypothetical protein